MEHLCPWLGGGCRAGQTVAKALECSWGEWWWRESLPFPGSFLRIMLTCRVPGAPTPRRPMSPHRSFI